MLHRARNLTASTAMNHLAQFTSNSHSQSSWGSLITPGSRKSLLNTSSFVSVSHHPITLIVFADTHLTKAKEERQLYTLKPTTVAMETPLPTSDVPLPLASKPLALRTVGPIRPQRESTQAWMQTGRMTPALKARILRNLPSKTSQTYKAQSNATQVTVPPIATEFVPPTEADFVTETEFCVPTELAQPSQSTLANGLWDEQEVPSSSDFSDGYISDSLSYTSMLPDAFDAEMDDLAPAATGPWMIIDDVTGELIVDEGVPAPITAALSAPSDSTIQVNVILGVATLVQTPPPTLLFADHDERPNWLIRSTNNFLQHAPYYMCLNEVVDLFFAQEARLGYPYRVSGLCRSSSLRLLTTLFTH